MVLVQHTKWIIHLKRSLKSTYGEHEKEAFFNENWDIISEKIHDISVPVKLKTNLVILNNHTLKLTLNSGSNKWTRNFEIFKNSDYIADIKVLWKDTYILYSGENSDYYFIKNKWLPQFSEKIENFNNVEKLLKESIKIDYSDNWDVSDYVTINWKKYIKKLIKKR
jgi:hypothetical protein